MFRLFHFTLDYFSQNTTYHDRIGVILAFSGLVLLTGNGFTQISFSFGQALTLFGAIAIALEIILIGYFAGKVDLRRVTVIQLVLLRC